MELSKDMDTTSRHVVMEKKKVAELLKNSGVKGNVVFDSETAEDTDEEEIEEIIEIIEEVEEYDEEAVTDEETLKDKTLKDGQTTVDRIERKDQSCKKGSYSFAIEDDSMFTLQTAKEPIKSSSNAQKATKQVINYDVDEDWEDEEMEHADELDSSDLTDEQEASPLPVNKKRVNNQAVTIPLQLNKVDVRVHVEPAGRSDKPRDASIGNNVNMEDSGETTHEIVKNVENNLLYTVLGTKKQDTSKQAQQDAHYVKMERLDENTIPVEGTIYYEGDNMETLYVAQAVDDNEQYQYDNATIEQDEQMWEAANPESNQNQEECNSQDQIFLHEDEDGQLYFKDDSGALQPVYLTEDGNYAIAETNDDNDGKEPNKSQQNNSAMEDSFVIPDPDSNKISNKHSMVSPSSLPDDNEDNTVTISLIISEDENGKKRTQVIIPTTDNNKCDICNKSFKTSCHLLRHNRLKHAREEDITTRNFPCDLCPKRYPDQSSLARHRRTHTGDRPFQCLECHKNFPTSTALRRHLTLHNSQSRPLPCIYCGRRFMDKPSLTKHEESHMPNEQRTYTCDICQKTFQHITDLSMHKKYHDPDKKYDCEVCGREFNRLNNLQRHILVHQQQQGGNDEILSCNVCGITYKFMSSLTRHMVTTHMNPEKLRQQAEEQRKKRENNYRKYLENRKMYETQHPTYSVKRNYHYNSRVLAGSNDEAA